jgi:hypothetical protein
MQVTLAQAGIAAGILTLAWVVGGQQEVYSASSSDISEEWRKHCPEWRKFWPKAKSASDIPEAWRKHWSKPPPYPHQVFNTTSKAHAEKVAQLVPQSVVRGFKPKSRWRVMSKTPYAEARSYFEPWLEENDYFRTNQFLSEVKYEAESFSADFNKGRHPKSNPLSGRFKAAQCPVCMKHKPLYQDTERNKWFLWGRMACKSCIESDSYKAEGEDCPVCEGEMDFEEAYEIYPYNLCWDCADAVQEKREDHAHSAESKKLPSVEKAGITGVTSGATMEGLESLMMSEAEDSQEELAELRTKLSKQRTAMSAMRTALAAMGLYLAYDTYKDHKRK